MDKVNQKIIDAIIEKSEKVCPDSLALIGIYGSVSTGDEYEKSDLDLLILIQDDNGWKLGTGFILEDNKVGYDIYCTNWQGLRYDAECHHAQLSKLLDSKIVYVKNQQAYDELCKVREQTREFLKSEKRFERVKELIEKAKISYANAYLHETLGEVRMDVFQVVYYLLDAIMLYHGAYFKRGVKRVFEELAKLPIDNTFSETMMKMAEGKDIVELRNFSKKLLLYVENYTRQDAPKEAPSENLIGTYEEMYSNWRNKVEEAANNNNTFASYANMCSFSHMCSEISSAVDIEEFSIMDKYCPDRLEENVRVYDECLQKYEEVYEAAGIKVKRFSDIDAFIKSYLEI